MLYHNKLVAHRWAVEAHRKVTIFAVFSETRFGRIIFLTKILFGWLQLYSTRYVPLLVGSWNTKWQYHGLEWWINVMRAYIRVHCVIIPYCRRHVGVLPPASPPWIMIRFWPQLRYNRASQTEFLSKIWSFQIGFGILNDSEKTWRRRQKSSPSCELPQPTYVLLVCKVCYGYIT
jgi:hypothetical protein